MRARVVHAKAEDAGVRLTEVFNRHLQAMRKAEAADPEVQNRHSLQLREARRTGRLGPTLSFSGDEASPLFHRGEDGFAEIGTTLGLSRREDGRGFVLVDLDRDGRLDVVHHNHFRNPIVALHNQVDAGNWMRIRLRGTESNRFGVGARVVVAGRMRELQCGSGYLSAGPLELHVGLGKRKEADVEVRWPSGTRESYAALAANRRYTLTEGASSAPESAMLKPRKLEASRPGASGAVELDVRSVLRGLKDLDGRAATFEGSTPRILIFFSESCFACRGELLRQGDLEKKAVGLGARLVWITTDTDVNHLKGQLGHIGATSQVYRPATDLGTLPVPTVYRVTGNETEKFLGRHAVDAALDAVRRANDRR